MDVYPQQHWDQLPKLGPTEHHTFAELPCLLVMLKLSQILSYTRRSH